jgi:hypothetical protein
MKQKLKIGILLNSPIIPAWQFKILQDINKSEYAEFKLLIRNEIRQPVSENRRGKLAHSILKLLDKTDRLIFKSKVDYDCKKDVTELFGSIPELDLSFVSGPLSDGGFNEIARYDLDIILKFDSYTSNEEILKTAKYGIWSNSFDNSNFLNGIKSGFWEVVSGRSITNSALIIAKTSNDLTDIVFNCWESTCPFSISINRNNVLWRTSLFMPRLIRGLYNYGDPFLERQISKFKSMEHPGDLYPRSYTLHTASKYVSNYFRQALRMINKKLFYSDDFDWQVLFEIQKGRNGLSTDFSSFRKLVSPKEIFWADPFILAKNDNYFIFVEEYIYKAYKAHIAVLKLDKEGNLLSSDKIIERPYHMSYPFIFNLENVYYMIPETGKNKTIELYRCTDFPYKWEFVKNIMANVSAVDTTLFFYNNKCWLFTSIDQTGNISGNSTELFLFYADDIFSDKWKNHPDNPIVSDVRTARPAGKLFIHEDKIYRPSQNCTGRYGRGFNISQVTKLTEYEYSETLISETEPGWDSKLKGIHTLNSDGDFTVIDVYSYRKRFKIN